MGAGPESISKRLRSAACLTQDLVRVYYTAWGGLKNLRAEYYADRQIPLAWALAPYFRTTDPAALRARCRARIAAATNLEEEHRALLLSAVDAAG